MNSFVRELTNIIGKSNFSQVGNTTKLLIRLYPEQLGSLRIELLQKDGILTAKILTSTTAAKEMIDQQLNHLKHSFQQQNVLIDRIEVSYNSNPQSQYTSQQEQKGREQFDGESSMENTEEKSDENVQFQDTLSELLFETEV